MRVKTNEEEYHIQSAPSEPVKDRNPLPALPARISPWKIYGRESLSRSSSAFDSVIL